MLCPICNMDVPDLAEHTKREADRGDEAHRKAREGTDAAQEGRV